MKWKILLIISLFLVLVSSVSAIDIASDGFESGTFSGGLGWNGNWVVGGQQAYAWYFPHTGTYGAFVNGMSSITRETDTSSYSDNKLGFWLRVVSPPVSVKYVVGGVETNLVTINSVRPYTYYEYDLPSDVVSIKFNNDAYSSSSYVDDITITGEVASNPEVSLIMDNNYVVDKNSIIYVDSTETSTIHTIKLSDYLGNVFCEKNVVSPSVAHTLFSVTCDMPSTPIVDAKAEVFVTNDESINFTRFFNVISLAQDDNEIEISQIYFSPQVLQGGSTEIFAIIQNNNPLDYAQVELTYPNGGKRILIMQPTDNLNEYRAYITDTFLVGNVSFEIYAKSGDYFDVYNNQYQVVAYNVDFVNVVNEVNRILEPSIQVHGTEYRALDPARMFIQLLDGYNAPVNDSDCYMSIYYPNNQPFKYKQKMTYVDEGLYFLDFITPYMNGVYMASSYCVVNGLPENTTTTIEDNFDPSGTTNEGSGWKASWVLGGASVTFDGSYVLSLNGANTPYRTFDSNATNEQIYIEFTHKTRSLENNEYYYVYLKDASGVDYLLYSVTNGGDDNVWKFTSQTLTNSFDGFDFDGELRLFVSSTNVESGDYFTLDDIVIELTGEVSLNETEYQIVRGSGEVHVTSDNKYTAEKTSGQLYFDDFYTGFYLNYNVQSQVYTDTDEVVIELDLYAPFPCGEHLLGVEWYNGTDWVNVTNLNEKYNHELDGCSVTFDKDLDVLENFDVRINVENYWKQQILSHYANNVLLNDVVEIGCYNYVYANNLTIYEIPRVNASLYYNDSFYTSCDSYLNAFYHYENALLTSFIPIIAVGNYNFTLEEMNALEGEYIHIEEAGDEIDQYAESIIGGLGLGSDYSLALIADPYPPTNPAWATYFAGISSTYNLYVNSLAGQGNIISRLAEINESINNLNVTGGNVSIELPIVMVGGTEYVPNDEGLIAVRLSKTTGGGQTLITGATCDTTILYPDTTTYVSSASMTEYGSGIYYYNFSVPSDIGVYIYSVDCADGGKDYFSMNTFHVSPFYNWTTDLSNVLSYLNSLNLSITGIDADIQDIIANVTSNNNYLFQMNGTLTNTYNLLTQLNTTISNIYTLADSMNATIVDIQGTIGDIESVVLDINGSMVIVQNNILEINSTTNTINNNVIDIQNSLTNINSSILSYLSDINSTQYDYSSDFTSVLDYLNDINNTQGGGSSINYTSELADIYNLLVVVNSTSSANYTSELADIYSLLQIVNTTQVDYSSELSNILSYLVDINNTEQYNYSSDFDNLLTYLIDINNSQVDYGSEFVSILAYLDDINNSQVDYSTELSDIYSLLTNVNATQVDYSTELSSILAYLGDINNTQFNYSSDFANLESYLISINNTQYDYTSQFNNVLTYLQDINDSQVDYSTEIANILAYLDDINNTQFNYSSELSSIITYLQDINSTEQYNYSSELSDIYSLLSQVNSTQYDYSSDFTNLLNYLVDINNTQYDYSTDFSDIDSLLASLNISNDNIYNLLLEVNSTEQYNYSSDFTNLLSYLIDINNTQVDYSTELSNIYSLLGVVNGSTTDIYSLLAQVNSTQVNYTSEFNNLLSYLVDINGTQINYTTELADIYSLLTNVNNTQDIYSTELADIYSVLLNVNSTQVDYSSEFVSVFSYLNNISSAQINYTGDLADIYSVLLNVNNTQVDYSTELADIYALLTNVNGTQFNYSSELSDIYSLLSNVNNTQVNYSTELADMYSLLQIINSTQYNYTPELDYITILLENVNGSSVDYSTELADIYSLLSNVNATQVNYTSELNNVLAYLQDINMTTTQAYTLSLLMNTTLFDVYDIVTDMNVTMTDLYAVSLVTNSSVADIYSLNQAMNISVSEIFALNVVMNTSINDINNALATINTTLNNVDNGVIGISNNLIVMNGTINSISTDTGNILINTSSILSDTGNILIDTNNILTYLGSLNTTIENIQSFVITINTTSGTISSNVIDIQSSLVDINDSIISLLDGVAYINGTINNIQNDILYINSSQTDMYSLLVSANSTIADNNEILLALNISCSELGIDIADLNTTLNDIYALELVMNDSIWFIENLSVVLNDSLFVINSTTMDTYQLLLSVNTTMFSFYDEFTYLQDLINNQTDFLTIALADVSFFNESEYNASDYYTNHTLLTPSILETQLFSLELEILDDPIQGDGYNIIYYFYNEDTGELKMEYETSVIGNGTKQIVISSDGLEPSEVAFQGYLVFARVEMLNGNDFYQSFPLEYIDTLDVYHLSKSPFASKVGLYDVIVNTNYNNYEQGESIVSDILIKNTGDEPDQDTILTYWLEDAQGNRYSETKEQILEVPVGETHLTRSLLVPLGIEDGELRFVAEYETIVQPKISVYDSVQVLDLTIFDKINQRLPILLKLYRGIIWASLMALILLIIVALLVRGRDDDDDGNQRFKKFVKYKPKR